ncbi:hypothetical protein Bbelb_370340 [Branchiostoma belcheri]|nr:hypothetical protein Bbelb_370340 [Branchiostoma belcheri]
MEESYEKANQVQSENDMVPRRLKQTTEDVELKDKPMEEKLRDKDAEISQIKGELEAANQRLQSESERAREKELGLRRCAEEKDRLTQTNSALRNELATKDKRLERMTNATKQAEESLQQKERELYDKVSLATKHQQSRTQAEAERDDLKTERDSLKTKIDAIEAERDSLQYRLSKEFCIRLASDETNMENISEKHRPAKIAEKFGQIESKEWVEAKEVLDDISDDEKTNTQILLGIFEVSCKRAQEVFDRFLSSEASRLYNPIVAMTDAEQHQDGGGSQKVPGSILKEIASFLKGTCGDCDIEALTQSVVDKMRDREEHGCKCEVLCPGVLPPGVANDGPTAAIDGPDIQHSLRREMASPLVEQSTSESV